MNQLVQSPENPQNVLIVYWLGGDTHVHIERDHPDSFVFICLQESRFHRHVETQL